MLSMFQKLSPLGWIPVSAVSHVDTGVVWRPQPRFRFCALVVPIRDSAIRHASAEYALLTASGEAIPPIGLLPSLHTGWRGQPGQETPAAIPCAEVGYHVAPSPKRCLGILFAVLADQEITGQFQFEGRLVKVRELVDSTATPGAGAPPFTVLSETRWPLGFPYARPQYEDETVRYPVTARIRDGVVACYDFNVYSVVALRLFYAGMEEGTMLTNADARVCLSDGKDLHAEGIVMRRQTSPRSSSLTLVENFEYRNVRDDSQVILKPRARMLTLNEFTGPESCRWHDHLQIALAFPRFPIEDALLIEIPALGFRQELLQEFP